MIRGKWGWSQRGIWLQDPYAIVCITPTDPNEMQNQQPEASSLHRDSISQMLRWASIAAFAMSMFMPAYHVAYYTTLTYVGYQAFLIGPLGFAAGQFAWLANPLLLAAWIKRSSPKKNKFFVLALMALPIACSFLLSDKIVEGSAGMYRYQAAMGFYVWLVSIAFAAAAVLMSAPVSPASLSKH